MGEITSFCDMSEADNLGKPASQFQLFMFFLFSSTLFFPSFLFLLLLFSNPASQFQLFMFFLLLISIF